MNRKQRRALSKKGIKITLDHSRKVMRVEVDYPKKKTSLMDKMGYL